MYWIPFLYYAPAVLVSGIAVRAVGGAVRHGEFSGLLLLAYVVCLLIAASVLFSKYAGRFVGEDRSYDGLIVRTHLVLALINAAGGAIAGSAPPLHPSRTLIDPTGFVSVGLILGIATYLVTKICGRVIKYRG